MSTSNNTANCPHCGTVHNTTCPRIKSIEYYQDGSIKRVELHAPTVPDNYLEWRLNGMPVGSVG